LPLRRQHSAVAAVVGVALSAAAAVAGAMAPVVRAGLLFVPSFSPRWHAARVGAASIATSSTLPLQAAAAAAPSYLPTFKIDISEFTTERALERHAGACGGAPEVEIVRSGEGGVFAASGTLRVSAPALDVFKRLTDPEENQVIFARTCAAVNYRDLIEEDSVAQTRLFEVSKTGRWRLLGIPLSFESTVYALEDWRSLEIRFRLKRPGAMSHMSGFWRIVPVGPQETLVLFYNEAVPSIPMPRLVRSFAGRAVQEMCASLLEDLRGASSTWAERPLAVKRPFSEDAD